jgi:hypothetical protein
MAFDPRLVVAMGNRQPFAGMANAAMLSQQQGQPGMPQPQPQVQPITGPQPQGQEQPPIAPQAVQPFEAAADLTMGAQTADAVSGSPPKMGIVAMAEGGPVQHFASGGGSFSERNMTPEQIQMLSRINNFTGPGEQERLIDELQQKIIGQVPSGWKTSGEPTMPQQVVDAPPGIDPQAVAPIVEDVVKEKAAPVDDGYMARMKELLSGDEKLSDKDKWMALLQASLGTMAAASKPGATFLGSVGEGGGKGIEGLNDLRKERAINRMKQASLLQASHSDDALNKIREEQLEIQKKEFDLKEANSKDEKDPNSPKYKLLVAQAKQAAATAAYALAGVDLRRAGSSKVDNIMSRANALVAESREAGNPITLDEGIQRASGGIKDAALTYKDAVVMASKIVLVDPGGLMGKPPEEIEASIDAMAQRLMRNAKKNKPTDDDKGGSDTKLPGAKIKIDINGNRIS